MNLTYFKNDIAIIENVFTDNICHQLIQKINELHEGKKLFNRQQSENAHKTKKQDYSVVVRVSNEELEALLGIFKGEDGRQIPPNVISGKLAEALQIYRQECFVAPEVECRCPLLKFQMIPPGGGYHVWHSEREAHTIGRYMVFLMYLNTLPPDSAGETEFIRQELKVTPKENTVVFWPATYTHPHRGNPVYGKINKYILTGWVYI